MPIARRPTPPPEAIKQNVTVMEALNAWTAKDEEEDEKPKKPRVPLQYTPFAQKDKNAAVVGWRMLFDSESDNFNFGIGMVIIANAIVIGLETDLGRDDFVVFEHVFNTVFVLEMLTRIFQIGGEYFCTLAYLFDFSLVLSGSLDLWILPAITGGDQSKVGYQMSVMRLLRILRLLRVLRVVRLFRMFGQLLLMVKAFSKALQVVLLLSVLVFILMYSLGIVLTQMVGHKSDKWSGHDQDDIEKWFGDVPASMSTLFWIMFGSAWDPVLELLSKVYPVGVVLLFFAFYMVISVALLSLIVGLITESLIIAQQEFKTRTYDGFAKKKKILAAEYTEELNALLEDEMDEVGAVEARDLMQAVKGDSGLITKLIGVGVSLSLDGLQSLVEHMSMGGTQRVVIDHFVEKLTNLSGSSSASAVVDVKYDLLVNSQKMDLLNKKLDQLVDIAGRK